MHAFSHLSFVSLALMFNFYPAHPVLPSWSLSRSVFLYSNCLISLTLPSLQLYHPAFPSFLNWLLHSFLPFIETHWSFHYCLTVLTRHGKLKLNVGEVQNISYSTFHQNLVKRKEEHKDECSMLWSDFRNVCPECHCCFL